MLPLSTKKKKNNAPTIIMDKNVLFQQYYLTHSYLLVQQL